MHGLHVQNVDSPLLGFRVWRIPHGGAKGLRRRVGAAGLRGDHHYRVLRCMPCPAAYARKSNRDLPLLTPLPAQVVGLWLGQGFMTFSRPARRSNVEQVWPPCRPLHFANPSPIMPKHAPHAARTALTPSSPTDSHSLLMCSTHRLEAHSTAAGGGAARPKVIINLREG